MSETKSSIRLCKEGASRLLDECDNFLFDCDGVVWNWPQPIPGSVECINELKRLGKKCFFITNNSTKTRQTLIDMLRNVGIQNVTTDDVVCTAWILAEYLKSIEFAHKVYVVGSPAIGTELSLANINHFGIGPNTDQFADPGNFDYKNKVKLDPEVKCVVVGFDHYFNFPKMLLATSYAQKNPGCLFIATNDDAVFPTGEDSAIVVPGTGSFVSAVCTSVGRKPIILGKPHRTMWEVLASVHQLNPARTCMVGDRLDTDIALAPNCSLKYSLAVLTGITSEQEINRFSNDASCKNLVPDFFTDRLGDLRELIKDN